MSEWEPIDTAPKDAKMLLLLEAGHGDDYHSRVLTGFWGDRFAGWKEDDPQNYGWLNWHEGLDDADTWRVVKPTHWAPLPAPPKA